MTDPVLDLEWDDPEPTATFSRSKADEDCWRIFEFLRGVGRPACRTEIILNTKVDSAHVSQRIERGRRCLGMQLVGGKAGFGQERLPLCDCCKTPKSVGRKASSGVQMFVLVSPDLVPVVPRDIGVILHEEGDDLDVAFESYEITDRYSEWEKRRLELLLRQAFGRWKRTVGQVLPP
jgi:hypothetical protein